MPGASSLFDRTIAASLPFVPRFIVKKFARRYVAGESLDDAVQRVRAIQARGACATLDVLGEEISRIGEGERARDDYLNVLDTIAQDSLDANISIKLTAFGLKIDPEVTYHRVHQVVVRARELGNFVRIDMEDSSTTDATLALYRRLRKEGFDNVGIVLQACLRRSRQDVADLGELEPSCRLCKGIYVEPEEIACKGHEEINDNFMAILGDMFERHFHVGIATHDHDLAERAEAMIRERGIGPDQYEFQMLLGVYTALGERLLGAGHKLRIYVPFGDEWYLYCMRRLKENPKIGRYVLLGMFRR